MITIHHDVREQRRDDKHNRNRTYVECVCGKCGGVFWLRPCDAVRAIERGSDCRRCQQSAAGKKGYFVAVDRFGRRKMLEKMANTAREHPNKPEQRVAEWLTAEQFVFLSQYVWDAKWICAEADPRYFVFDFIVGNFDYRANSIVIEVNGYHHEKFHKARDKALVALWPGKIIWVMADDVMRRPMIARANLMTELRAALVDAQPFVLSS